MFSCIGKGVPTLEDTSNGGHRRHTLSGTISAFSGGCQGNSIPTACPRPTLPQGEFPF